MYTVAYVLPTGEKVLGRNRPTLGGAEKLALQRVYDLNANPGRFAGVVLIGNKFEEIQRWTPTPQPTKGERNKASKRRRNR
jgi:hypothetical protein